MSDIVEAARVLLREARDAMSDREAFPVCHSVDVPRLLDRIDAFLRGAPDASLSSPAPSGDREAFERWWNGAPSHGPDECVGQPFKSTAWKAWQAARALPAATTTPARCPTCGSEDPSRRCKKWGWPSWECPDPFHPAPAVPS